MCGIVGYIGPKDASAILLDGLRRLEYRGYDSAGIAVWDGSNIGVVKSKGRVADLAKKMRQHPLVGTVGIAHTRWATHGAPSDINAHPHADTTGTVFIVHNGIVENYARLKEKLVLEGHVFASETDSEIIAHLIYYFIKKGFDFEHATKQALKRIRGTYALLAMSKTEPGTIIAARLASPLRIGVANGETIVASDPSAILRYTQQLVTMDDGEVAVITKDGFKISRLEDDVEIAKEADTVDWNVEEMEKGGYEHFTAKEIFEQPEAIKNSMRGRIDLESGRAVLGGLSGVFNRLRKIKKIHIVACGTAYHAGLIGEYMLEEYGGISTEVCIGSEFRYRKAILNPEDDAVLVISQSGETADTLAAVREAKEKGVLTLGIVNVVGSTIAQETDAGVYNHAGPEIGVISTKVFVSQLTVLALLSVYLGRQRDMSVVVGRRIGEALQQLPQLMSTILSQSEAIKSLAQKYSAYTDFMFLGRKYNYPIAPEGALKLKEVSYVHAEGVASGELKHGPLAMIDADFPVVFICPKDSVYEKNISNLEEVRARNGIVIAIATEGDKDIARLADDVVYIPKTLEMLTPLLSIIPLQLFAYYVAVSLGLDIDKPRNIAKSVTVE